MNTIVITFDGGTPCNIPRLGYGIGYGSYAIDHGWPIKVNHGVPMSCNVAEITTLIVAIESLSVDPRSTCLIIEGDSKIALNRCKPRKKKKKDSEPSAFGTACRALLELTSQFQSVETRWRPRALSVAEFGH